MVLMLAGTTRAVTIEDSFDWGSGVAGRTTVTNGQNISGLAVQTGGVNWVRSLGAAVFSGTEGIGTGALTISGSSAIVRCDYAVTGLVSATMEYVHQTVNTNSVDNVWLGFSSNGARLLSNEAYARVYVRMHPKTGQIFAGVSTLDGSNVVDNVDNGVSLGGFAEGDRLIMTLTVDVDNLSAVATVSNVTQGVANSVSVGWTEPGIALTSLAINETSSQIILVDSVRVAPVPPPQRGLLFALQSKLGPLDVYICAGQSNMTGGGYKSELPPELQAPQPNVSVFNGSGWEVMAPTDVSVGPEISFAYEMQKALNKPIGIILHAVGGTNLATNWNPLLSANVGNLYAVLTNKVEAARQTREIHVKGMIWMQGEADSRTEVNATAYSQNLTNLILAARADFSAPDMPFSAGRVNPPINKYSYVNLVRTAQETCAVPGYSFVNCDDLTKISGDVPLHYDTAGLVELGKRFAQNLLTP
jgi:hypothetical protein